MSVDAVEQPYNDTVIHSAAIIVFLDALFISIYPLKKDHLKSDSAMFSLQR